MGGKIPGTLQGFQREDKTITGDGVQRVAETDGIGRGIRENRIEIGETFTGDRQDTRDFVLAPLGLSVPDPGFIEKAACLPVGEPK